MPFKEVSMRTTLSCRKNSEFYAGMGIYKREFGRPAYYRLSSGEGDVPVEPELLRSRKPGLGFAIVRSCGSRY